MNKKLLFGMFAAAGMLMATSCSNDELDGVQSGNESVVSFTLEQPGIATRAYSDGKTATSLTYAVYETGTKNVVTKGVDAVEFVNKTATVNLRLVNGKKYDIIFWADEENAPYTFSATDQTITIDYTGITSQKESLDAFFGQKTVEVNGSINESVTLNRPFAQLNIGTTDQNEDAVKSFKPTQSSVTIKNVYKTLNLMDGSVSDPVVDGQTYALADIPGNTESFPVDGVKYLSMNYLLVDAEKELISVDFNVGNAEGETITRSYTDVPVQRNYRTNIYGKLLTDPAAFNITIDPVYKTPDYEYTPWDGVSATEFTDAELAADVIEVKSAADLAGIAKLSAKNNFAGKTIALKNDIDLAGMNWTPIGSSSKQFAGTFDGENHTISGVNVEDDAHQGVGFIGQTAKTAVVKNVNLIGCKVTQTPDGKNDQGYVGGLVGWNRGTVENCNLTATAENPVIVNGGLHTGGLVGQNEQQGGVVKNCKVIGAVQVTSPSIHVGGVVGYSIGKIEGCSFINEDDKKAVISSTRILSDMVNGHTDVGGISGFTMAKGIATDGIYNCTVKGNIELRGMKNVGGIYGYCAGKVTEGCTVEGVKIFADMNGGGLAGRGSSYTIVRNCSVKNVTLAPWTDGIEMPETLLNFIGNKAEGGYTLEGTNTVDGVAVD